MKLRIESSVVIDRPIEDVFDFVAVRHRENHTRWDTAVSRLEADDHGPMGLGTRFRIIRRNVAREESRAFTVTAWDPPYRMAMTTAGDRFQLTLTGDFEVITPARTRHILRGDAVVGGPRALLAPVMRRKFQRDIGANLARIKQLIEVPELATV